MNARLVKLAFTLCSLCLFNPAVSVRAQDTNPDEVSPPPGYTNGGAPQPPGYGQSALEALRRQRAAGLAPQPQGYGRADSEPAPVFDIQIENGELSLAPLAGHSEITNFWAPRTKTVPATMENLSRYLRATDTNLNVILSPGTSGSVIPNLKLKTIFLRAIPDAINVASGNTISGNAAFGGGRGPGFGGFGTANRENSITFTSSRSESRSSVEVFNLSGYILTLYSQNPVKVDDKFVMEKIDELQHMVLDTLEDLHLAKSSADFPNFKYHPGTKLLIVIGKPEAIEVTRKIINALSGQQTNGKADLLLDTTVVPSQN